MTERAATYTDSPLSHTHSGVDELLAYDASVHSLWPRLSQWMMVSLGWSVILPGGDATKVLIMLSAAAVSILCLLIWNDTRKIYKKARHLEESLLHTRPQDATEAHIRDHISQLTQKLRRYTYLNGLYSIAYSLIFTCFYLEETDLLHLGEAFYIPALVVILACPIVFFPKDIFLFFLLVGSPLLIIGMNPSPELFVYCLLGTLLIPGLFIIFARQAIFRATVFGAKLMLCFELCAVPWLIPLGLLLPLYLQKRGDSTYTIIAAQAEPTWVRRLFTDTTAPSPFPWKNKFRSVSNGILSTLFFILLLLWGACSVCAL